MNISAITFCLLTVHQYFYTYGNAGTVTRCCNASAEEDETEFPGEVQA